MSKPLFLGIIGLIIIVVLFASAETDYNTLKADEWNTNNLNQAGDLSSYPAAWQAINQEHGLDVDLTNGATYNDGKLTNGDVTLDLAAPGLSRTKIVALSGGGFSISKGTSENFEYDGNSINFGGSTKDVEVRSNGEIVLPKGATMMDKKGNEITAIQDNLIITEEGSKTKLAGVGKIETSYGKGYVGVGDYNGELTLTQNNQISGKNYVWSVTDATYTSRTLESSSSQVVFMDKDMREHLKSILGGNIAELKTQPSIAAELKPYFDALTAQELSWKMYTEYNPSTVFSRHNGLLSLSRTPTGTAFIPRFMGSLTGTVEGNKMKIPFLSSGDSQESVEGYYANTPYGKGAGAAFKLGEEEKIAVTTGLSPNPAVTYEKSFGRKVVAKVTVHPGIEETNTWVSVGWQ